VTNLTFRLSFVRIVSAVKGIFLRIPGLCRTENLPKLPSFSVEPVRAQIVQQRGFQALDDHVHDVLGLFLGRKHQ
jgi:hypothetical protein